VLRSFELIAIVLLKAALLEKDTVSDKVWIAINVLLFGMVQFGPIALDSLNSQM
jgi:hypothetical protein